MAMRPAEAPPNESTPKNRTTRRVRSLTVTEFSGDRYTTLDEAQQAVVREFACFLLPYIQETRSALTVNDPAS